MSSARSVSNRLVRLVPRLAILATAISLLVGGDPMYGVFCLLALALTLVPAIVARDLDAGIPLGLELALLAPMLLDMTVGNGLGFYRLGWYDKALHLCTSILLGAIGIVAVFVLHLTHRTKFHPWLDGVAILLVGLGLGALWELAEYGVDHVFGRATQGSPTMSPLDDTMTDLLLDGIGAAVGAVLGPLYIRSRRRRERYAGFARRIHPPE